MNDVETRAKLKERFKLDDADIDRLGGPARCVQLFLVTQKATELSGDNSIPGRRTFKWCVVEAAKYHKVRDFTEEEQDFCVLATGRYMMSRPNG